MALDLGNESAAVNDLNFEKWCSQIDVANKFS